MSMLTRLTGRLPLWTQQPQVVLRVLLALAALVAFILGSGAGTQWE